MTKEDDPLGKYLVETVFPDFEDIDIISDRATGIVAAALIDDRLTVAIKSRLRPNSTLAEELFGARGRLGDFGVRIDLGYLLGAYDRENRNALHAVREIRNKFAHEPGRISFESDLVAQFIRNLAELVRKLALPGYQEKPRQQFIQAITYLLGMLIVAYRAPSSSPDKPAPLSTPPAHLANPDRRVRKRRRRSSQE